MGLPSPNLLPVNLLHPKPSPINYLAHAYLSFGQPAVLAGNMISDFVKGKKQFDLPPDVQVGIRLHRAIDSFTDEHAATRQIRTFFQPHYRLFSGAFTDIAYDYFLANDGSEFKDPIALRNFAMDSYQILEGYTNIFPERFAMIYPYMVQYDWLSNYRHPAGIERSFYGLTRRSSWLQESDTAFKIFMEHLPEMERHYRDFFPELKQFAAGTLTELLKG